MRRSFGFQPQCYADDGMWMDTQAQQQSYAFHEESWSSDNNSFHKQHQFPGMHVKKPGGAFAVESELSMSKHHHGNKLGGTYGMCQETRPNGHGYGFGKKHGGTNALHHFSNGGVKFNGGGGNHGYFEEESNDEYEAYSEEHHGAAKMKVDEMRYEHHNWGGDHGFYANPYDHVNMNMNWKPHGGHMVEWTAKGV